MRFLLILLFIPTLLQAQEFQFRQELDSIQVWDGEYQMPAPWTGGYAQSSPDFCDIDEDSDQDLFVGNGTGMISFYRNEGNSSLPVFNLEEEAFSIINVSNLMGWSKPVFWDMDADGDFDLFVGSGRSLVRVYENIGSAVTPDYIVFEDTLKDANGNWFYCDRPQFVDIDDDGDQDLFCGRFPGTIDFYRNIGDSTHYIFQLEQLGIQGIDVGYSSAPAMVDIDSDGDYDLFIGNKYGKIYFYRNDGTPQQYDFTLVSNNWFGIDVGDYASPEFCDIDADGDYDLFIGKDNDLTYDIPGAMQYWENTGTPQNCNFVQRNQNYLTFDAGNSCTPVLCDIDSDEDLDLFFSTNAQLGWMRNNGTPQNPDFEIRTFNLMELSPGSCQFTNLDGDAIPDLITAGGWSGLITYYRTRFNNGNPEFVEIGEMDTPYAINQMTLGDVDSDGADEMVLGGYLTYPSSPILAYYENSGSPGYPNFTFVTSNWQNLVDSMIWLFPVLIPTLIDVDMDNDLDLLMVNYDTNTVFLYTNIGSPQSPQFQLTSQNFLNEVMPNEPALGYGDIDADGDMDIFTGHYQGGIKFFRNVTDTSAIKPYLKPFTPTEPTLSLFPNPSNAGAVVRFTLPGAGWWW
ncbi:MAG: VCBS repeat-containing protein [bacterium]|nr:VCBS repeat-containing protein [bacterium]